MTEKKTILIVDDEPDLLDVISFELNTSFNVITASNGKEALDSIQVSKPDIILSDINMPIMDGLKMIEKINDLKINIPIIFITAFSDFDKLAVAWKYGAFDFIDKPIDFTKLNNIIQNALNSNYEKLYQSREELTEQKIKEFSLKAKEIGMSLREYLFSNKN